MKNLLIYINPSKCFNEENEVLVKIQIDNSLSLGWSPEDIILATNFDYEYNGVKSVVVGDENFWARKPAVSKIPTIISLIDMGVVNGNEVYWFHDMDVYQCHEITESELEMDGCDFGATGQSRMPIWSSGILFFKASARDIFYTIKFFAKRYRTGEERAMVITTNEGLYLDRIKRMNITYNIRTENLRNVYRSATKPIRCVHFHPTPNRLDFYMYGKNKIGIPLMPQRLIDIFHQHGIQ